MAEHTTEQERLLRTMEQQWQVRLSVHDELGLLRDRDGALLLPRRNFHPHPYCEWCRNTNRAVDRKCWRHCVTEVMRRLREAAGGTVETQCWKGVREVVVPVAYGHHHALTVFIGAFRKPEDHCPLSGAAAKAMFQSLPLDSYERLQGLAPIVRLFFVGLLYSIEEQKERCGLQGHLRRRQIEQFIHQNADRQGVSIADLARELSLSESRAAHLVKIECGTAFHGFLTRERLHRAKALLLTTSLTVAAIAERTGFATASYFCRIFQRHCGISPSQFREAAPFSG